MAKPCVQWRPDRPRPAISVVDSSRPHDGSNRRLYPFNGRSFRHSIVFISLMGPQPDDPDLGSHGIGPSESAPPNTVSHRQCPSPLPAPRSTRIPGAFSARPPNTEFQSATSRSRSTTPAATVGGGCTGRIARPSVPVPPTGGVRGRSRRVTDPRTTAVIWSSDDSSTSLPPCDYTFTPRA